MNNVKTILMKELQRVFKDRKLLFSLFILPPLLIVVIYGLMGTLIDNMSNDIEEHKSIVFVADAPSDFKDIVKAIGYDAKADITYISKSQVEDLKDSVLDGATDLIVSFPDGFDADIKNFGNGTDTIPSITVHYNFTKNYSSAAYQEFIGTVVSTYKTTILNERLDNNMELLTVFNVEDAAIVDEDAANGQFLAMMVPYLVVMLLFASAMGLCVDATAGEKERGTLATLLMTPAKRSQIAFGKLLGLAALAAISAILYAAGLLAIMPHMTGFQDEAMTGTVSFSAFQIVAMFVLLIALVYLFVAIISFVSLLAKDVKTASTLVSPMYIIVILLGMSTMFSDPGTAELGLFAIPVYGTALAIQNIMINALTVPQLLLSIAGEIVLGIVFTYCVKKAFDSEKIIFNA